MINFDELKDTRIDNFKNGEGFIVANMYVDENNKILRGTLKNGSSVGYHSHDTSSEIIYILNGEAKCILNDKIEYVKKGEVHYCPKGASHSIINEKDEDLIMLCVVPNQ